MAEPFDLGKISITPISDGWVDMANAIFPRFDPVLAGAPADGRFRHHIFAFLLQSGTTKALVDTGSAGNFGPDAGRFAENLAKAGVGPDDVDVIVLTHLHSDHYGGLAGQDGSAVFPRARLYVGAEEWWNTHDPDFLAALPDAEKPVVMRARAAVAGYADRTELVRDGDPLGPGLAALALPGHTPGHMGITVTGTAAKVMLVGDMFHCADYQGAHPDWSVIYDHDPAQAARTRTAVLSQAAAEGWVLFGAHLGAGEAHRVKREGAGFRLDAVGGGQS